VIPRTLKKNYEEEREEDFTYLESVANRIQGAFRAKRAVKSASEEGTLNITRAVGGDLPIGENGSNEAFAKTRGKIN
jgi:hypothetical protein